MKFINMHLRSRLSDSNLEYLMKIAIEVSDVDLDGILDILKIGEFCIIHVHVIPFLSTTDKIYLGGNKLFFLGGGIIQVSPPLYESLLIM